jgi:hypothetical protein
LNLQSHHDVQRLVGDLKSALVKIRPHSKSGSRVSVSRRRLAAA